MEPSAQIYVADLPRTNRLLTDGTRRSTTLVPSVAAIDHRMQRLEQALAALTKEHKALDEDAVDRCLAGLEVADSLLVASAHRDIKGTLWKLCHPFKHSKKCDMLRRHVGIARDTYEKVVKRYQDAVRPLAELGERAKKLGDDARQVLGSIDEVNAFQERKQRALDDKIEMGLKIWSNRTLTLAKHREREQEARAKKEKLEMQQAAGEDYPTSLFPDIAAGRHTTVIGLLIERSDAEITHLEQETHWAAHNAEKQQAKVESLRLQRDGTTPKAERSLVAKLGIRMGVFRSKLSKLRSELRDKEEPLRAVGDRCLGIAARLSALQKSGSGDLVLGVKDLARGITIQKHEKKKEEKERRKSWEMCKSAERPRTSFTSCLGLR
ncbi:hypothetical protein CGRA01v4_01298 [Colletotrichum graminicola]|uniref:Uncharacterized protein n=1 Tax=Colletotrichum graminicola (strain M1.001 / M2 / FGSC 10212) TaxID=645133 RepID=E3QWE5_COLGM|nr:uncharacterized protein GLRG_10327 [Colletotrichum graminicola M1.001]EFQ35183.1 hypothetical protein GLRG_10327 [Colletotrichum graminicola M1.001]WDK10018.1 hypothetical protein CGRA01v4_01298 [Colletotrichum graminicola]